METSDKMIVTDSNVSTADVATDMFVSDDMMIDNESMDGISTEVIDTGNMEDYTGEIDTPKAGISTQIILYIVIGVCAAAGIALGIIRGIKVAKK